MRRYFIIFIAIFIFPATALAGLRGDLDKNGRVDIFDLLLMLKILSGQIPISSEDPVYLLYQDIVGNAEFESDGDYPPPANLDNDRDDLITVTLFFGEDFAGGFRKDQIYGYYLTTDDVYVNFIFPFAPAGKYWLSAELVLNDTCYFAKTEVFQHESNTTHTYKELHPVLLGVNQGCFDVILSSAEEPVEYVQHGPRTWINKKVYDRFYKKDRVRHDQAPRP